MNTKHLKKRTAEFGPYWLLDPKHWTEGGQTEIELWRTKAWAEERGLKTMIVMLELRHRQKFFIVNFPAEWGEPSHYQVTRLYESQPEVADMETESYEALVAQEEGDQS